MRFRCSTYDFASSQSGKKTDMLRLCCCCPFACEDCLKPREPLATRQPFISVVQPFVSPPRSPDVPRWSQGRVQHHRRLVGSGAGRRIAATEWPVPDGAGRRTKVSCGRPLCLALTQFRFSFVCCGFKCVISPVRPESAITPQIRRRETPAAARFAGRYLLPTGGR